MSLPADASLYQYPAYANARTYDAEFDRLLNLCWAAGEGIAPLDQSKDTTLTNMGFNKSADLEVLTNSSGLQVSVTAGQAWVKGDYRTTQGLYFCRVPTAQVVTMPTAHATLPRIDAVILKVYDADIPGDGTTQWTVTYAQGTATAGANLTNLTGAPVIPDTALLLAYVHVPAAFAGPFVTATHIQDRRFFAYRPGRLIGYAHRTADLASGAELAYATVEVVADGSHRHRVQSNCRSAYVNVVTWLERMVYDGAVGGTVIDRKEAYQPTVSTGTAVAGSDAEHMNVPTGRKTYTAAMKSGSGTWTVTAGATYPAKLSVRYV